MKTYLTILTCLLLAVGSASASGTKPEENLPALVNTALADNPELRTTQARWEMFRNRISQAGSLDDPMLMLKIQNGVISDPLNFHKESMTAKVIGLSQQLPFWGKRGLKQEMAAKDAESYRWQVQERKLELVRMVKETYYRIYNTDKSLEIVDKNIKVLDDFITIAETKYSVGQGTQQDVFKSQVERSKLLDMKITLEQGRKSLAATLNALLFRSPETAVGRIPDFETKPLHLSAGSLRETAYESRPMIKSLKSLIEKGELGHKLARKEFYPDFNVSLEYMQREPAMGSEGLDMYSLGVTFNLPLQQERRHAMVAESDSEVRMSNDELDSLRNTIGADISGLLAKLEKRERLITLYKTGIIPQAEQSLDSAVIGYRVNKVDFLSLLDSRVTLFNYERELYESQAEYMMILAQLEAVIGKDPLSAAAARTPSPAPSLSGQPRTPATAPASHNALNH
ncbi:MAG: TolC family protein [Geobacteraceae bacterium]|nr:TolC family protein [Geobacteraceae bacterium]